VTLMAQSKRSTAKKRLKTPSRALQPSSLASETDSDENYTPDKFFAPLHLEFQFTLDPCATAESAKCPLFFTKAQDGLKQRWAGHRVWLNPPYSDITPWLRKVTEELKAGCPLVVALLPSWTDRRWWHHYIERGRRNGSVKVRFVQGRISFGTPGNPEGVSRGTGKFPSALVWQRPGYVVPDHRQLDLLSQENTWKK
jgi:phage N-6-adenine-methyltransferase